MNGCEWCGSQVPPPSPAGGRRLRRFCSDGCQGLARRERERTDPARPTCAVCGEPIRRARTRTCSLECGLVLRGFEHGQAPRSKFACRLDWDRLAPRSPWSAPILCGVCGSEIEAASQRRKRCAECLRAYRQQARQRWKASPAGEAWKRAYDARRRARVEHLDADRITIRALAERDGWTCHLCGETVPDVRHRKGKPKMDGPTIDHRLPLALGGQHTWDNVALAHFICNSRRGAMPLEVSA